MEWTSLNWLDPSTNHRYGWLMILHSLVSHKHFRMDIKKKHWQLLVCRDRVMKYQVKTPTLNAANHVREWHRNPPIYITCKCLIGLETLLKISRAHAGCARIAKFLAHSLSRFVFTIRLFKSQIAKHFSMHENIDMHTFSTIHMGFFQCSYV